MILENITLCKEDFDQCGWHDVIIGCAKKECSSYYNLFFEKSREAEASGDRQSQGVFILLGAIASFSPNLDSLYEPFKPWTVLPGGSRSTSLDDISDSHLDVLKEIAPHVLDAEMRARIADILWVKKRDFRMAGLAIDSYLASASVLEHPEQWPTYTKRIERAMQLAVHLGSKPPSFPKVTAYIESLLDKCTGGDFLFPSNMGSQAKLMETLQAQRQGSPSKYAALSEKIATHAETQGDWFKARTYWEIKARWYVLDKDDANKRIALQRAAETYVQHAEATITKPSGGYLAASLHLQGAIAALRKIGGMQERVNELHKRLLEYEKQSLGEFEPISVEIDVHETTEKAKGSVKGKTITEALLILASLCSSPKVSDLRNKVQEAVKNHLLFHIAPSFRVNDEGKVIGRRPIMNSGVTNETEAVLRSEMLSQAAFSQRLHAQAIVEPVRLQILLEHSVRIEDLLPIVWNKPLIPEGREYIYAKGLHAGLTGDFLVAAHLLIPQLESSIRYLLTQYGVIPSSIDSQGIQEEYTLSKIIYCPELKEILGEDITFDLQGSLVESAGSNLRNLLAHGLITHDSFFSEPIVYLWWLTLRLCCLPMLVKLYSDRDQS